MAEFILPQATIPSLPAEEAIEWGASVKAPDLLALANAITHLVAARGRRFYRRTFTPHIDLSTPTVTTIDDLGETHTLSLIPSPHCNRYHVRVAYQADPNEKVSGGAYIRVTLMTRIDGTGTDLDEVEWNVAEGTLAAVYEPREKIDEATGVSAQQFALLEVQTAQLSRPGAGSSVSRPLEIGTGTPDPDFTIKVVVSDYIRVLAIDVWEAFEEVIEQ